MKKPKISHELLLDLLRSGRWNDFTVSELKAAYMMLPNCSHRSEKTAWQFVYRSVARMESCGLISRLVDKEGAKRRYQWIASVDSVGVEATEIRIATDAATLNCLREKLHRYKVEMLTVIGETEEYDALCKELPHMRDVVQTLYNDARDRCSKTLGRVKALESILADQFSSTQP